MAELIYLIPFYMLLGCVVGFCAGLLGVGGGVLLVPGLYAAEKYWGGGQFASTGLMPMALATSMSIIIPTGLSSSAAQIKRGAVRWDAFRVLAPGLVAGVTLGITVISKLENDTLRIIFAIGLYVMASLIFLKKETENQHPLFLKPFLAIPVGAIIGMVATMLGIGGATLNVPYLSRAGVPLRNAIATSSVLGVVVAFPAALGFLIKGFMEGHILAHMNVMAWVIIAPISMIMAPIGVKASHAMRPERLRVIFTGLLVVLATKMLLSS